MSKVYYLDWFVLLVDVIVTCMPYVGSHCEWKKVECESIDREWVSVVVQYAVPISQPVVVVFLKISVYCSQKRQK